MVEPTDSKVTDGNDCQVSSIPVPENSQDSTDEVCRLIDVESLSPSQTLLLYETKNDDGDSGKTERVVIVQSKMEEAIKPSPSDINYQASGDIINRSLSSTEVSTIDLRRSPESDKFIGHRSSRQTNRQGSYNMAAVPDGSDSLVSSIAVPENSQDSSDEVCGRIDLQSLSPSQISLLYETEIDDGDPQKTERVVIVQSKMEEALKPFPRDIDYQRSPESHKFIGDRSRDSKEEKTTVGIQSKSGKVQWLLKPSPDSNNQAATDYFHQDAKQSPESTDGDEHQEHNLPVSSTLRETIDRVSHSSPATEDKASEKPLMEDTVNIVSDGNTLANVDISPNEVNPSVTVLVLPVLEVNLPAILAVPNAVLPDPAPVLLEPIDVPALPVAPVVVIPAAEPALEPVPPVAVQVPVLAPPVPQGPAVPMADLVAPVLAARRRYPCVRCTHNDVSFDTIDQLMSHSTNHHSTYKIKCLECGNRFGNQNELLQHHTEYHSRKPTQRLVGRHHRGRRPAR